MIFLRDVNESKLTLKVKSMGKTFLQKYLARNRYNYYMYMYPKKFLLKNILLKCFTRIIQIIKNLSLVNNFMCGIQAIYNTPYQQTLHI